jgi:DNA-directed RNA polymerase sigma subunit (sigma70/sigma32)
MRPDARHVLPARHYAILRQRAAGSSLREIGEKVGPYSAERIRQLEGDALRRLGARR